MNALEPVAIALAGPMGKLAWAGIMKCSVKHSKHRASIGNGINDTSDVVGMKVDEKGRIIGETYDRYANKLGAKFVQGDYKARRDLFVINNYGDFRIVRNDISRMLTETMTSEVQTQSFLEDLNRASDNVLQALQDLATRVDSTFDVDRISVALKDGDPVPTSYAAEGSPGISSSLCRALDRSVPLTLTEGDTKYCHGAAALQKATSRTIEDIAVDGKSRMQYTYVCKFCFLQMSNYQRLARNWGPYEWVTLAKSHVVACTSWLDSRALFKCIDCDKLGREHVTIDAEDFIIHTQEHLQNASTGKVSRHSAYFHENFRGEAVSRRKLCKETMAEVEKEIAAYEKAVEKELAGDPVVQNAKAAAEPLVEEDKDDNDTDEWYHTMHEAGLKKEPARESKTPVKRHTTSDSAAKSPDSDGKHVTSRLESDVTKAPTPSAPHPPKQRPAPNEPARNQTLSAKSPLAPVLTRPPESPKDTHTTGVSVGEKGAPDHSRRSSRNSPAAEKAVYAKGATSPSPVQHRPVDSKISVLPTPAAVTEPDDGLSACPGCGLRMKTEAVFEHLDTCPSNIDSRILSTQQDAHRRSHGSKQEAAARPMPEYIVPPKSAQRMSEADFVRSQQAGGPTSPIFGDNNSYQLGNRVSGTAPTQAHPSVPTRPPPVPPLQQAPKQNIIRKTTPAEAVENYDAQRYSGQAAMRPQTPSNQRSSRDLHVRQTSTPTTSAQRIPQPPGGFSDWHPTFDEWQARQ